MEGLEEVYKKHLLVCGGAFRCKWQFPTDPQPKLRYLFILNKNPQNDDELVVVTSTTKIEERYKNRFYQVLVKITPEEYEPLEQVSLIDCASAFPIPKSLLQEKKITLLPPLPDAVMTRIRNSVQLASTIKPRHKRLVLGEETV